MTTEKTSHYRIIRRAYSQFTEIDVVETTWLAATLIAMMMETYNGDGEYFTRQTGEPHIFPPSPPCPVQAAWAYL